MASSRGIALNHHEKWDGSGYPRQLKAEEIPLESRITGLVDVYDALTSKRPYKDPYPTKKACTIIADERGKHFDPKLVDSFLNNIAEFVEIKAKYSDEENTPPADYNLSERDQDGV